MLRRGGILFTLHSIKLTSAVLCVMRAVPPGFFNPWTRCKPLADPWGMRGKPLDPL